MEKKLGSEKLEKAVVSFSVFLGVLFSVGLFFLLPTLLSGIFDRWIHNAVVRSLIEGCDPHRDLYGLYDPDFPDEGHEARLFLSRRGA